MQNLQNNFIKIFLINCFAFCILAQNVFAANSRNLTVFAEQSMVASFTKIARLYSQKSNVVASVNFNSSSELMNEVDSGEPADVFISAHSGFIESLKQKGLIDVYNIGFIARDKLALVTSKNNKTIPAEFLERKIDLDSALRTLDRLKLTIVTDQTNTSSGKYSNDYIKSLNLDNLQLFKRLEEDKSSVLQLIKNNPENYALLLLSQIKNKPDLQIIASAKDANVFYQALVIAGDNMETAREFLKFLKSDAAKSILRDSGFIVE